MYRLFGLACALCCAAACKREKTKPPGPFPPVPIPASRAAYVTDNGSDALSVLDRDGDRVSGVSVDIDPDRHEAPHHLAVDARSGAVFVALAFPAPAAASAGPHASHGNGDDSGELARLDLATLHVAALRDVDPNPGDVILTHDLSRVLVTHFDMKRAMQAAMAGRPPNEMFAALEVLDARTLAPVARRALCVAPHGVVTTKDDRTAIVACYGSDEIAVVDLTSPTLSSARYPLGSAQGVPGAPRYGPYSVTLSPDESLVLVADLEGESVRVLDMTTRKFVRELEIPLGARAFMPAFAAEHTAIVPLQAPDGLVRIDVLHAKIEARTSLDGQGCVAPHVVRIAKDRRAYVVCEGDHVKAGAVLEIDPVTLAVKKRWEVGVYPDGIAFGEE